MSALAENQRRIEEREGRELTGPELVGLLAMCLDMERWFHANRQYEEMKETLALVDSKIVRPSLTVVPR